MKRLSRREKRTIRELYGCMERHTDIDGEIARKTDGSTDAGQKARAK